MNRDIFLIIELWSPINRNFDLFDEKIKQINKLCSDNARLLDYKVNLSFLIEKLPYSQIRGKKGVRRTRYML